MSFWDTFIVIAAVWLTPVVLIGAWILADYWLDGRGDVPEWDASDAAWLGSLSDTPIYEGLAVERLHDDLEHWGRS